MYTGKFFTSMNDSAHTAVAVRAQIPEFNPEQDEHDAMAIYAVAFDEDSLPSGTGRLYIDDESHFRIDFLGVVPEKRGRYIGDLIARMLLFKAQQLNAASVYISAPVNVIRFFARYGFALMRDDGKIAQMSVSAEDIRLEGSCSKGRTERCAGNCAECASL